MERYSLIKVVIVRFRFNKVNTDVIEHGVYFTHSCEQKHRFIILCLQVYRTQLSAELYSKMTTVENCLGHQSRIVRKNKIKMLLESPLKSPDKNLKILIKKGPVSEETSLKELEEYFANRPEWKVIEDGGVLSIPLEEFRMVDPPKPDRSGLVAFDKKKEGKGTKVEDYTVGQTIEHLNALVLSKYNEEKEKSKANKRSKSESERFAATAALKLPLFCALKAWQDIEAEIKLKKALENMMCHLKIPALIIRSVKLKAISALKDLGLGDGEIDLSKDAEIDLILVYVSGRFLNVVICEVKRADTYPWQTECPPPNKKAINSSEKQLTKDLDFLMAILAGIPPSQIVFHTLACFPDTCSSVLQDTICTSCMATDIVFDEDLADLSLLQKKTRVPDKPDPATTKGKQLFLTLIARFLSHQSLLHLGYREVDDKEKLVAERHRYNLESVDKKMKQKEFVVASPQQQQVIANFTASSTKRHLVLEGPAGTGKTLMALQMANNLLESATDTCEEAGNEPVLVVTAVEQRVDDPIMKYLDASTGVRANKIFKGWNSILTEFRDNLLPKGGWASFGAHAKGMLVLLADAAAKRWDGRQIVMLVDEIIDKDMLRNLGDRSFPTSVRMILVVNPSAGGSRRPLTLPTSFLHVTLTTP